MIVSALSGLLVFILGLVVTKYDKRVTQKKKDSAIVEVATIRDRAQLTEELLEEVRAGRLENRENRKEIQALTDELLLIKKECASKDIIIKKLEAESEGNKERVRELIDRTVELEEIVRILREDKKAADKEGD